jgi:hypothetical protein
VFHTEYQNEYKLPNFVQAARPTGSGQALSAVTTAASVCPFTGAAAAV